MSLLTSHMWWVHQDAILVGQSQSSMWMWQQATGTPLTEHISYVTCSLVPLDLSSSRIKFWRVLRQWQLRFNQAQRSSKYGVLSNCTGHLPKKLSDLAVVLLCWQWRLLLAPRTCSWVTVCANLSQRWDVQVPWEDTLRTEPGRLDSSSRSPRWSVGVHKENAWVPFSICFLISFSKQFLCGVYVFSEC